MQLAPRLHLVASGSGGIDLTDPFDCHVYLLDGGNEAALVDTGIGRDVDALLRNADAAGVAREVIRYALLTHAHADHSGGAAALKNRLPHLEVVASPPVANYVRGANEHAMSLETGKRAGFYPADYRFAAADVAIEVSECDRIKVGALEVKVVETPGHSEGHLTYLVDLDGTAAALTGDLVFFGGLVSLVNTWDCHIQEYAASITKLAQHEFDLFLPGHHSISLRNGRRHVDTANRLFANGFVPRSVA
jgi:hydroxyacylglutathione hydrolase